ncbi:hypothetical protein [Archangium sp.]|uniref:hypothetical protein n=1 Tax=Archangium sp. TaxID=1872627 RepID=UPI002D2ADCB3|nr:hypothetical protein [Archangium sp.]HYO55260.1 hypothetical protein [Archangium sp.]
MRRVKLPLNQQAARIANEKIRAPASNVLREKWLDAYSAAGGMVENETPSQRTPKSPIQPCTLGYIELQYLHVDATPVCGARYEIRSPEGQLLYEGKLDGSGRVRINGVPREQSSFLFHFEGDPARYTPHKKPSQKPDPDATRSMVEGVGRWLWGTLQGDFNKNPSMSQIAVNTLLGLIPLVDQALDLRDIIAGLKDIIEYYTEDEDQQKKHSSILGLSYEVWLWLNIFIIAMGCIPELGSAIKGVFKGLVAFLVDAGKKVDGLNPRQVQALWEKLVRILNHFGKGNAHEWLKQLPGKIDGWMDEAVKKIRTCLDTIESLLKQAEEHANSWFVRWIVDTNVLDKFTARLRRFRSAVHKAYVRLDSMKAQVNQWLRDQFSKILPGKHLFPQPGSTGGRHTRIQHEELPPDNKSGRALAKELAEKRAKEAAESAAAKVHAKYGSAKGKPNCAAAVVDQRTGREWTATSGGGRYDEPIHPDLDKRIKDIPEEHLGKRSPTNCAEFRALNEALNAGARAEDLVIYTVFTEKVPKPAHRCPRCQHTVVGVSSIPSD